MHRKTKHVLWTSHTFHHHSTAESLQPPRTINTQKFSKIRDSSPATNQWLISARSRSAAGGEAFAFFGVNVTCHGASVAQHLAKPCANVFEWENVGCGFLTWKEIKYVRHLTQNYKLSKSSSWLCFLMTSKLLIKFRRRHIFFHLRNITNDAHQQSANCLFEGDAWCFSAWYA